MHNFILSIMKNPKWHRDEIILALDLYFQLEPGQMHAKNPKIIELSKILNQLPLDKEKVDIDKFRNPNGVGLKLCNFLALDPDYSGKGMQSYSKLDYEVFKEFVNNKKSLHNIANTIKAIVNDINISAELDQISVENEEYPKEIKEGKIIYKLHKYRERNSKISQRKKELHLKNNGHLKCEVCSFDFYERYGDLGLGYMECHHIIPLSQLDNEKETTLNDLALVCSNCHRMLHRKIDKLSIKELKNIYRESIESK
ncbi:MAG: HNH endonuclease [Odoribacter splanchnicus]|nr:HNH endonuclease [Odoribacter splanchnicus]